MSRQELLILGFCLEPLEKWGSSGRRVMEQGRSSSPNCSSATLRMVKRQLPD